MKRSTIPTAMALTLAGLLSACSDSETAHKKVEPAKVEAVAGSAAKKITLTNDAVTRIALETVTYTASGTKAVPYASIVYDTKGATFVYINTEPLVFVRQTVKVDRIDSDRALLVEGPADGAKVVVVGVAELYGAETGVGK